VAYETAARIAREAIVSGTPIRELIRDNLLTPEQLDSILDPFEMTSPGIAGAKEPKQEPRLEKPGREELRRLTTYTANVRALTHLGEVPILKRKA
jgi:hypothetical protein